MTFTLQDLIDAGLPIINEGEVSPDIFSRELTPAEWETFLTIVNPLELKKNIARVEANAIPGWANITQAEFQTWWNANLADSIVDAFAIPAGVKAMLKNQNMAVYRMGLAVIAMRNYSRILG